MHRSFWNPDYPGLRAELHRTSGNAQALSGADNEWDHKPPDLLPDGEYCRRSGVLSVLVRPRKNNIAGKP